MAPHFQHTTFHEGELAVQKALQVSHDENPTWQGLHSRYDDRIIASPLVALGAIDDQGRPWMTVVGGEAGFARRSRPNTHLSVLDARSLVSATHDPVVRALFGLDGSRDPRDASYGISKADIERGRGALMAGLTIDLATRDRVKFAGRLYTGDLSTATNKGAQLVGGVADMRIQVHVDESLGNCPKYLNKKAIRPHAPSPKPLAAFDISRCLPRKALDLLDRADLFFISSTDGVSMDANHRGGPPGFVRVMSNNSKDGVTLIYPEYSGNRLYQTLGNFAVQGRAGICVPDFATGDVLYLSGHTQILFGPDAARVLPHTKLAVKLIVEDARFVEDALPFRGDVIDYSPYNPPVRRLASEIAAGASAADDGQEPVATATLLNREVLSPTIARFTFGLRVGPRRLQEWTPGQHVTLDFGPVLDIGWAHMRDDDPGSLNDDFVRTFTVSNVPPRAGGELLEDGAELQITARRHGLATKLLWQHDLDTPLQLGILGFGGTESFRLDDRDPPKLPVFVAAGVGITPVLGQAPALLARGAKLQVLWSLRGEDLPVAVDTFERIPSLAERTMLRVTGVGADPKLVRKLSTLGSAVVFGKMTREVLLSYNAQGVPRRYYLCTGPGLHKELSEWLAGEGVRSESFEY